MSTKHYRKVRVNGRLKMLHRVVWEEANGPIPEGLWVDHINGDIHDNRLENLRVVTPRQNAWNRKTASNIFKRHNNTYQVRLKVGSTTLNFGTHKDVELAELIAQEARVKYFGEYGVI
jgi:hypothetical protein